MYILNIKGGNSKHKITITFSEANKLKKDFVNDLVLRGFEIMEEKKDDDHTTNIMTKLV